MMDIENKIAYFNGDVIAFGYLDGKTEHLLPMPDGIESPGLPIHWSCGDLKKKSSTVDGVVEEFFADPLQDYFINIRRHFNRKNPKLLDVFQLHNFLVLSEKAKKIVDECDGGIHQFGKVEFLDNGSEVVGGDYYTMIPLRFVRISEDGVDLPDIVKYFDQPSPDKAFIYNYLYKISEDKSIREYLLSKGIWSMYGRPSYIFMSGKIISKFLSSECTGLKKFTKIGRAGLGEVVYYV